ncbi:hypothetical protein PSTG_13707 [Puccinia striiformis f. sp. tritici PST-78]|uniref:Uncharacterized protein n=1 Tax=Puccinia striiformis f. sp. tritici PST-78 TaxID=1165861 RepID=A0A0L0V0W6_9BASI|nr:hypothetical protein PSTG_13707 [Puccinia striiformis f. sp. tritici PST-78]
MEDTTTHNQIISLDLDTKPDHNQDLLLPPDTKRIKLSSTNIAHQSSLKSRLIDQNNPDLRPESVESISVSMDLRDDELRIPINLDIISGNIHLTDRFEWEIRELNNSPEDFVEVHVNDLGLAGEFKTAITHSIQEHIATYVKSLTLVERESTVKRHVASVVRPVVAVESLYPIENLNVLFVILYPFKESKWLPPIRTIMMRGVGRPLTAPSRTITTRDGGMDWESMGLHDSMIDGVWNCGNCGCPDQIAIDRWKGLGGKDTLCGECGQNHKYVCLVGSSATLPSYADVAPFLRVNPKKGLFFFDSSDRPCPLKLEFIGITEKKAIKRLQLTNEICYDKAMKQLDNKQQIIIFVHFRSDTTKLLRISKKLVLSEMKLENTCREDWPHARF